MKMSGFIIKEEKREGESCCTHMMLAEMHERKQTKG
jgi:hypothetical protein